MPVPINWPPADTRSSATAQGQPALAFAQRHTLPRQEDYGIGFAGTPVMPLEQMVEVAPARAVGFFGLDRELNRRYGSPNRGAASFVRQRTALMMPWLQRQGAACYDLGVLSVDQPALAAGAISRISATLARRNLRPALIACDHTASLAHLTGMLEGSTLAPTYLYFDAHFDLGYLAPSDETHNGNFVDRLLGLERVRGAVNIGGRAWSTFAPIFADLPKFRCIPGGPPLLEAGEIIRQLAPLAGAPVYVSLDADVVDPAFAPNVSCPEPFGLSFSTLLTVCAWLGRNCRVIGGDLCEIMPSDHSLGSEQALMRCFCALFGVPSTAATLPDPLLPASGA